MPNFTWVSNQNGWLPADYFSFKRVISGPRRFTSGCWTVDGCGGVELWCVFFLWVLVFHTFVCTSFWWNTCRPWLNSLIHHKSKANPQADQQIASPLLQTFLLLPKPFYLSLLCVWRSLLFFKADPKFGSCFWKPGKRNCLVWLCLH